MAIQSSNPLVMFNSCPVNRLAQGLPSLDDWSARFDINNFARHSAPADACASVQLLLVLMNSSSRSAGALSFADLIKREKTQRSLLRLKE
jgi:hypothetical protein